MQQTFVKVELAVLRIEFLELGKIFLEFFVFLGRVVDLETLEVDSWTMGFRAIAVVGCVESREAVGGLSELLETEGVV